MTDRRIESKFVTLFYGIIDEEGTCTYSNAGHNPPILLRQDGSSLELTEGGVPLGILPHAEYDSATIQMLQGDHLVLYTDGVTEALNRDAEEFGRERLYDLLKRNSDRSAEDILHSMENALSEFSEGTPQHDDITMMVLGYRE